MSHWKTFSERMPGFRSEMTWNTHQGSKVAEWFQCFGPRTSCGRPDLSTIDWMCPSGFCQGKLLEAGCRMQLHIARLSLRKPLDGYEVSSFAWRAFFQVSSMHRLCTDYQPAVCDCEVPNGQPPTRPMTRSQAEWEICWFFLGFYRSTCRVV